MSWLENNQDDLDSKSSLDKVLGDSYAIELLKSAIPHSIYNKTFHHPDMQSFLLYGESGCGKKTLAYALGVDLGYEGYEFINIDATQFIGEKVKKTRENIEEFFGEVIEYFSEEDEEEDEEYDPLDGEEDSEEEEEESEEKKLCILIKGIHLLCRDEVSVELLKIYIEYLQEMEGISCVLLMTTNKIESVPRSLRNCMVLCHIEPPSLEVRAQYLKNIIAKKKIYVDYLLTPQKMSEATEGFDFKKLNSLVKNMEMMLKREFIKWSKQKTNDVKNNLAEGIKNKSCQVTQEMFDKMIEQMKEPAISEQVIGQGVVVSPQIIQKELPINTEQKQEVKKETKKTSFEDMVKSIADDLPSKPVW